MLRHFSCFWTLFEGSRHLITYWDVIDHPGGVKNGGGTLCGRGTPPHFLSHLASYVRAMSGGTPSHFFAPRYNFYHPTPPPKNRGDCGFFFRMKSGGFAPYKRGPYSTHIAGVSVSRMKRSHQRADGQLKRMEAWLGLIIFNAFRHLR